MKLAKKSSSKRAILEFPTLKLFK